MNDSNSIHIADLSQPIHTYGARLAIELSEHRPLRIMDDELMTIAARANGLDDFGNDDFVSRLQRWLFELNDPTLTEWTRATIFELCINYLSTRLRLRDLLIRHPEIDDVVVRQPIIIAGIPRSGTTHLINLLNCDPRLRALSAWEAEEPIPLPWETLMPDGTDPRVLRAEARRQQKSTLLPHAGAMYPSKVDNVVEDVLLQGPDFASCVWEFMAPHRYWKNHYFGPDQTPHYAYMKKILKALQWLGGPDRWVLKTPGHVNHLRSVMTVFPDAIIVLTHRDPVAAVQSAATMWAYTDRMRYRSINLQLSLERVLERFEAILQSSLQNRHLVRRSNLIDVFFHDFSRDKIGTVSKIYSAANLPITVEQRSRIDEFLAENPRGKFGRITYDLEEDFGVSAKDLRTRFSFYYEEFPVEVEIC